MYSRLISNPGGPNRGPLGVMPTGATVTNVLNHGPDLRTSQSVVTVQDALAQTTNYAIVVNHLRVLDAFAGDGYDAVLAGHTHGGQLCLPVKGAIVTNCDLDPARAKGLHRHPADSRPGDPAGAWLHVSAGLGTSPYVPVRFCCRPEATLLTLTARPA